MAAPSAAAFMKTNSCAIRPAASGLLIFFPSLGLQVADGKFNKSLCDSPPRDVRIMRFAGRLQRGLQCENYGGIEVLLVVFWGRTGVRGSSVGVVG